MENKQLTPFKLCVLQNFPYIEADFDALTNYGLMCKIVEYLNKTIKQQNITSENVNILLNWFNTLDVTDEINAKLDEMATDGTLTNLIKRYVDPIYSDFEERITETVGILQDEVSSVTSGSPAGVYSTIASLQQADPDHSRIYVVEQDGNWYFWNNATNQWKNGGVYQATSITYNSISPLQTTFVTFDSLLNGIEIFENERFTSSGGTTQTNEQYNATDFIPIKSGKKIFLQGNFDRMRFYNANKVHKTDYALNTGISNTEFVIPTATTDPIKYFRIDYNKANDVNIYNIDTIKQVIPIDEIKNARKINNITYNDLTTALNESYKTLENTISDSANIYFEYLSYSNPILRIYMQTNTQYYMCYEFTHMIVSEANSDIWRLRSVYGATKDSSDNFTLVTDQLVHQGSEWESAIQEVSPSGFVGGSTHGNEVYTSIVFMLDNVRYTDASLLHKKKCKELRIIRKSNIYRRGTTNVVLAEHYVDYLMKNNTITIDNRLNWKQTTRLGICYMTMLGLKRTNNDGQVSSFGIKQGDGSILDISSTGHTNNQITKKCLKAYAFNDTMTGDKVFASVELLEDDYLPNSNFKFDNRENYNKFYFDHCGQNYDVQNGDIWHTKSEYKINYYGRIN